jgi:hypothetical protein
VGFNGEMGWASMSAWLSPALTSSAAVVLFIDGSGY